jgi:N-ethylmaleimide reductase
MQEGWQGVTAAVHAAGGRIFLQLWHMGQASHSDFHGGSIEKRTRFLREVVEAVAAEWPANRVGVRISPNGVFNDMGSPNFREQFTHVATMLDRCGIASLHVVDGLAFGFHKLGEPMTRGECRRVFSGPLMGNCGYTLESAERALAAPAEMAAWYAPMGAKGYTDFPAHSPG